MNQTSKTKLPYRLTNDYLFRAVFQDRPKALGKSIDAKDFILDLAVVVNHSLFLNLEMQMYYDQFWADRSLSYACRSFDNVNKGEEYNQVLLVVQFSVTNCVFVW